MTDPITPYWKRVLAGEEPQYCESYSGLDWKDAQLEAYWTALQQAGERAEKAEALAARYRKALERIWNHSNSRDHHHPDECELRKVDPEDQDDETCTCGYWAASYPMLKLEARQALAEEGDQ